MTDAWEAATWDGAARAQRARWRAATPLQRLEALRRMQRLALESGALQRAQAKKADEQEKQWKSAKQ